MGTSRNLIPGPVAKGLSMYENEFVATILRTIKA
jgi:hypothetical protein